jgi:phage-related protein
MRELDKRLLWWASTFKDLQAMPPEVQRSMGFALWVAQRGKKAEYADPLSGKLRDVMEIRDDDDTGKSTYRVMYTTTIGDVVYVLDAFQKKSKSGIKTPQLDLDRIEKRLKAAKEHYHATQKK